jgi:glucokinase
MYNIGLDIGGTKCSAVLGESINSKINIVEKIKFETKDKTYSEVLNNFSYQINVWSKNYKIDGIGISCGGPLNSKKGIILSPPNLQGWDNVHIVEYFEQNHNIKTYLQNDANACAVAEWKYGAGKGYNNIIFLTFGTGFGAGLILNGKLYSGTNDNAGEVGHIRLTKNGPVGYNKEGSAEGYCSGNGIKKLAQIKVKQSEAKGEKPEILKYAGNYDNITAKLVAELAYKGDKFCKNIYKISGEKLGKTLSILIDLLNPELIIIGGVYMRSEDLLLPYAQKIIDKECLVFSKNVCKIVPAGLKEAIGDYSAISIANGDYF